MKKGRICAAALGAALLGINFYAAPIVQAVSGGYYPPVEKDDSVDGNSLTPYLYDAAPLEEAIAALREAVASDGADEEVRAAYETLLRETDEMLTVQNIDHIAYYGDVNNQTFVDFYEQMDRLSTEYADLAAIALCELMNSPYAYIGEENMDEINAAYYRDYKPMTDRQKEIDARVTQLESQYGQLMLEDISVTMDGVEWTQSGAYDAYGEDEISSDELDDILSAIVRERNARAGDIYLEMVALHTEMTEEEGEDNYADWQYRSAYVRDYTTEEIQTVYEQVKTDVVPFYAKVSENLYREENQEELYSLISMEAEQGDDLLAALESCIYGVSEELGETFTFMRKHHLIDIDPDPAKSQVGLTADLFSLGVPYIFYKPYGIFYDYEVVTHEFGHFNNKFHYPEHAMTGNSNLDTSEIHSQGLELLAADEMGPVFGDTLEVYKRYIVLNMLGSIIDGCLFDEFQVEVYHNPDMTLDEMNSLFYELASEYGCEGLYDADYGEEKCYSWVEVSHTFEVPLYYISYATSALAALDIYTTYLEDADAGKNLYMTVTTMGSDVKYRALLKECGMDDIFDEGVIREICDTLDVFLFSDGGRGDLKEEAADDADREGRGEAQETTTAKALTIFLIVALCAVALLLVIIILVAIRKKKKQEDVDSSALPNPPASNGIQGGVSPYADSDGRKPRD